MTSHVVVVGSGAAGLAAALAARAEGAEVTLLEATSTFGGTTALSGGVAWLPANRHERELGIEDSPEEARRYLANFTFGDVNDALLDVYVRDAGGIADLLEDTTPLRWQAFSLPDYHGDLPGGRRGGRGLEVEPFTPRADIAPRVRPPVSWRVPATQAELRSGRATSELIEQRRREGTLSMGGAIVAPLLTALVDVGATVRTDARARELVVESGRVVGVRGDGVDERGAVILASGGFERDPALARAFLRAPTTGLAGAPGSRGDGLRMAMAVGADLGNMSEAWWSPTYRVPGDHIDGERLDRMILWERSWPGSLIVDQRGHRFVNEAANYNDVGRTLHDFDAATFSFPRAPSWMVFDGAFRGRYTVGPLVPGAPDPEWLEVGEDLAALAGSIGIEPAALADTVERFNGFFATGVDPDFGRGSYAFDQFAGDDSAPHPTLGQLTKPPFYALRIEPGILGTKGGPRTDADGRVLRAADLEALPGLFAAGNAAASPMGLAYPGAGGTIGPALVFGTRAGRAAAHL